MDDRICRAHLVDEKTLRGLTENYWDTFESRPPKSRLESYINDQSKKEGGLLNKEMCWAKDHPLPDGSRLPQREYQLLVMLVGFSVEPLLQTVWAYEPQQVLLLLNRSYGDSYEGGSSGQDFGEMVKSLIQDHLTVQKPLKSRPEVICEIVSPDPASVFRKLREKVMRTDGVIIDITGAKKSMVAGAFLYAAYANVPVSYVDFDDDAYDPERGRPYGYKCRIGSLNNPYQAFALRDWERVRQLYNQYNFRAARALLIGHDGSGGLGTIRKTDEDYSLGMKEPICRLERMLYCYELWESGDFNSAKLEADTIKQEAWNTEFPSVVTELGGRWFSFSEGEISQSVSSFYDDTLDLRIYVYDELKRVDRLIHEDCNSAFLRAAGVSEVLMVARIVRAENNLANKQTLLSRYDLRTPTAKETYEHHSNSGMTDWWNQTSYFKDYTDAAGNPKKGWERFLDTRNKLTHTHLTVPSYLAEDALYFVTANFEDFLGGSVESLGLCAKNLKWSQLCQRCGLAELLPPSLKEDK